jgi:hypothetical protein
MKVGWSLNTCNFESVSHQISFKFCSLSKRGSVGKGPEYQPQNSKEALQKFGQQLNFLLISIKRGQIFLTQESFSYKNLR